MRLTKKKAKELAIKKWQYIVENDGISNGLLLEFKILNEFWAGCPYCEMYTRKLNENEMYCAGCPILIIKKGYNLSLTGCGQKYHPYFKWSKNMTKENAQKVLDLIIAS